MLSHRLHTHTQIQTQNISLISWKYGTYWYMMRFQDFKRCTKILIFIYTCWICEACLPNQRENVAHDDRRRLRLKPITLCAKAWWRHQNSLLCGLHWAKTWKCNWDLTSPSRTDRQSNTQKWYVLFQVIGIRIFCHSHPGINQLQMCNYCTLYKYD